MAKAEGGQKEIKEFLRVGRISLGWVKRDHFLVEELRPEEILEEPLSRRKKGGTPLFQDCVGRYI